jgi:hypothetical protein
MRKGKSVYWKTSKARNSPHPCGPLIAHVREDVLANATVDINFDTPQGPCMPCVGRLLAVLHDICVVTSVHVAWEKAKLLCVLLVIVATIIYSCWDVHTVVIGGLSDWLYILHPWL